MTLGENLQELRRAAGLSQKEVAGRLFVSRQSVSKWENGQAEPGVENLKALAELYGVSMDELFGVEKTPEIGPAPEAGEPAADEYRTDFKTLFYIRTVLMILENVLVSFPSGRIDFPFDWVAMIVGLFVPRSWVWAVILVLEGINGLFGLVYLMNGLGTGVFTILIAGIMAAFLFSEKIKAYFHMAEKGNTL